MNIWLKLRVWWHRRLRHRPTDSVALGDHVILTNCSCGGYVQARWEESAWAAEYATCPLGMAKLANAASWRLFPDKPLPRAVALQVQRTDK